MYERLLERIRRRVPIALKGLTKLRDWYVSKGFIIPPLVYIDKKDIDYRESIYISLNLNGSYDLYTITEHEEKRKCLAKTHKSFLFEVRDVKTGETHIAKLYTRNFEVALEAYTKLHNIQKHLKECEEYDPYIEVFACGQANPSEASACGPKIEKWFKCEVMPSISIMARGEMDCKDIYKKVELTVENIKEIILQILRYTIISARYNFKNYDQKAENFILIKRDKQKGFYDLKICDLDENWGDICSILANRPCSLLVIFVEAIGDVFGSVADHIIEDLKKQFEGYKGRKLQEFLREGDRDEKDLECWKSKEYCDAVVKIVSEFSSLSALSIEIASKFLKNQYSLADLAACSRAKLTGVDTQDNGQAPPPQQFYQNPN